MYDLAAAQDHYPDAVSLGPTIPSRRVFFGCKRAFDLFVGVLLLPLIAICALALLVLNPFYNRGPLFFVQTRMGRNCKPFKAIKFRSMTSVVRVARGADCPLDEDRITPLGGFLRKSRIDELPQVINVLRGDMSLIGPRPDYFSHAKRYLREIPGYRARHMVRPGISGLAQTELGYAVGIEATRRKVQADLFYIANTNFLLELWIFWRTLSVVVKRAGS